jgi:hypothetical protein
MQARDLKTMSPLPADRTQFELENVLAALQIGLIDWETAERFLSILAVAEGESKEAPGQGSVARRPPQRDHNQSS